MRKFWIITSAILLIALLRTGWIFYSRWNEGRQEHRSTAEQQAKEARQVLNAYGGDRLTILQLTIDPPFVRPGETANLCYGVSNAKAVRFEPPVENVWPSMSRCVEVTAKKDTVFKLIAEDAKGNTETAMVPLKIQH